MSDLRVMWSQEELAAMTYEEYRAWEDAQHAYSQWAAQWHKIAFHHLMGPIWQWMHDLHEMQGLK